VACGQLHKNPTNSKKNSKKNFKKIFQNKIFKFFFVWSKKFLFPVVSKSESVLHLQSFSSIGLKLRDESTHTHLAPACIPQKLRNFFFRPIKKIFVSGFKWG